jgi:hypothetical protein
MVCQRTATRLRRHTHTDGNGSTPAAGARGLRRPWIVHVVVAWGVVLGATPHTTAAPLPPSPAGTEVGDLEVARLRLEARLVGARLVALGVSPADAAVALARLTPAERSELAGRLHEIEAGGDAASFLALAIIVALVVILVLELLGRRVISRP